MIANRHLIGIPDPAHFDGQAFRSTMPVAMSNNRRRCVGSQATYVRATALRLLARCFQPSVESGRCAMSKRLDKRRA